MKAIGLDIGTTSICGIRMDCRSGEIEKTVHVKNESWLKGGEVWEKLQDPWQIWDHVMQILKELLDPHVMAIGVTGQMHGILYVNKEGEAISPLITWQDGRGNLSFEDGTYASYLHGHTGYGNVTHFYNRKNGLVPEGAASFCAIHDYIVMMLTERKTPLVHSSDGAGFGSYDLKEHHFIWKDPLQPEITPSTTLAGVWRDIPVAVALGDNQASFFGGGCNQDTLLVNVGTGSQVSFMAKEPMPKPRMEVRPLTENQFLLVGSSLCGGRAYALLEQFLRQTAAMAGVKAENLYDAMAVEAEKKAETNLVFRTLFCGTREEPQKRAEILNLSVDNFTPGDFIRSCMRGIGEELVDMANCGHGDYARMVGTGNGIRRNPALKRTLEELFQMEMKVPLFCEEAAAGAALFSMTASGIYKTMEEAERIVQYDLSCTNIF